MNLFCPNCGKEIELNTSFCSKCGTQVENEKSFSDDEIFTEEMVRTTNQESSYCFNCGTILENGTEFCGHCGTRIKNGQSFLTTAKNTLNKAYDESAKVVANAINTFQQAKEEKTEAAPRIADAIGPQDTQQTKSERPKSLTDKWYEKNYRMWIRIIRFMPSFYTWLQSKTFWLTPNFKRGMAMAVTCLLLSFILRIPSMFHSHTHGVSSYQETQYSHSSGSTYTETHAPSMSETACQICRGRGICTSCEGKGYANNSIKSMATGRAEYEVCALCNGTGVCSACNGMGDKVKSIQMYGH